MEKENLEEKYPKLKKYLRFLTPDNIGQRTYAIEKADNEYIFNPFRNRIEEYKKAKERIKIKEFQKHNFMDQSFKIFKLKEKYVEDDDEGVEIKNHA